MWQSLPHTSLIPIYKKSIFSSVFASIYYIKFLLTLYISAHIFNSVLDNNNDKKKYPQSVTLALQSRNEIIGKKTLSFMWFALPDGGDTFAFFFFCTDSYFSFRFCVILLRFGYFELRWCRQFVYLFYLMVQFLLAWLLLYRSLFSCLRSHTLTSDTT